MCGTNLVPAKVSHYIYYYVVWLHFSPMVDAKETTVEADAADGLATSGAGNSIGLLRDGSYCVDDIELWTVRRAACS